jgi:hypothetical protein
LWQLPFVWGLLFKRAVLKSHGGVRDPESPKRPASAPLAADPNR